MGRKVSDGKAVNVTVPAGEVVVDNELYRIAGINGLSIGEVASTDAARSLALECDPAAIYSVHIPSALNPNPGDFLYWNHPKLDTGIGAFQYGATDLIATPHTAGAPPCFWVTSVRSLDLTATEYVVRGRIINGAGGPAATS